MLGALPACFITQEPDEAPWLVVYEPVEVDDASFLMALDRLGVVFEGDETEEQALLAFLGGRVIERRPGGLLVIELPVADRSELGGLARTIEETFPDTVASAGQIVHRPGDERPNLLCRRVRVAFAPDVPPAVARQTVEDLGGQVVFEDPDHPGEYLVDATLEDAQRFAERLQIVPEVVSTKAWPVIPVVNHAQEVLPFALQPEWQWHHRNTGQSGGVVDADVDTPQAWQMETGSVPLAVIDDGFEFNRVDFSVMSPWSTATKIFSNQVSVRPHGTKVAGLATARRDNSIPGSGSCPTCTLMPIQYGKVSNEDQLEAVRHALREGARVINLSFGYGGHAVPNAMLKGLDEAQEQGVVVVVALSNGGSDDDDTNADGKHIGMAAARPGVIGVTGADHTDAFADKSFGMCVDVLGPVEGMHGNRGVGVATTDLTGGGANRGLRDPNAFCVEDDDERVTRCFDNNSAAAPVVAGVAALVLSAADKGTPPIELRPQDVERLLRDTADRVDPLAGGYRSVDGRSVVPHPDGRGGTTSTHGYGRVNAYEAVRVVARTNLGGRAGVDIFVRDNALDWGNTEQRSSHVFGPVPGTLGTWKSPDIKVDAPPYQLPGASLTALEFEELVDEAPVSGEANRVYLRVRNRGPVPATGVRAHLHVARAGVAAPVLPDSVVEAPESSSEEWAFVGTASMGEEELAYSGSSSAGTPDDRAWVAQFDLDVVPGDAPDGDTLCLFAMVQADQDPLPERWMAVSQLSPEAIVPETNNVTLRTVRLVPPSTQSATVSMRNPFPFATQLRVRLMPPLGTEEGELSVSITPETATQGLFLESGEVRALQVELPDGFEGDFEGDLDLALERMVEMGWEPVGGLTLRR